MKIMTFSKLEFELKGQVDQLLFVYKHNLHFSGFGRGPSFRVVKEC